MSSSINKVSIPGNVKKTIQNIKEIAGNHPDDEVYAMLKDDCSIDPNETTHKVLLLQGMADDLYNWSELPHHLLDDIINTLTGSVNDFVRFGSVCTSWRYVYYHNLELLQNKKIPVLMVSSSSKSHSHINVNEEGNQLVVYNAEEKNIQSFQLRVPRNMFCLGSSHGWLVTVPTDENDIKPIVLFNPFLSPGSNEVQLPLLRRLPAEANNAMIETWFKVFKAVVSTNPTIDTDYTVMVIYGERMGLAFWKPGDMYWNVVQAEWYTLHDVIFYGHEFISVNSIGEVMACDVCDPKHQKFRKIGSPPGEWGWKNYVVESLGYLYQVHRQVLKDIRSCPSHRTGYFQVFKMDCQIEQWERDEGLEPEWINVNSLEDRAFFVGSNASMSRSAGRVHGIKPNCIYFTDDSDGVCFIDDKSYGPFDVGVFCVEDKTFEWYDYPMLPNAAPIWVEPTFGKPKALVKDEQ